MDTRVHLSGMTMRPLRKDAAERRDGLLVAARAVFSEEGIDAPLDRIAERAGVGRATLYRNFPGRTEIALAVLLDDVAELGRRFSAPSEPDAFAAFLTALSDRLVCNAALGGVLRALPSAEILTPIRARLAEAGGPALAVSKSAGTVRSDLALSDIRVLSGMLGAGLPNALPSERAVIAARALQLVLDAVKPAAMDGRP